MTARVGTLLGCFAATCMAGVTYKDIAPTIERTCQRCHRPNDIAPFALMTYDDVRTYAPDIRDAVSRGLMPPWKPVAGFGDFRDSFGITADERQAILDWVDQGAAEGDPLPANIESTAAPDSPWRLGQPDLILKMPAYTAPPRGDTYRCFVMPTGLSENRFVGAYQVLPGNKQQVHHVILYLDTTGEADKLDGRDGQPGYSCFGGPNVTLSIGGAIGGWAPGSQSAYLPDGIASLLPAQARVIMQVHYHPNGVTASDQTQVGLYFAAPETVSKRLIFLPIVNTTFKIPAGATAYPVKASLPVLPFLTGQAILVAPHMHLLGRTIRMDLKFRDGSVKPMIRIDDWDFNWQGFYTFTAPVRLPAGAEVQLSATYDNSDGNPRNPNNPLVPVTWGEGTNDEMCIGFLGVTFDNENLIPLKAGVRR